MVPPEPALKLEVVPLAVVNVVPASWLIEPPAEVTARRFAATVGSTTLPAVALKVAKPEAEMEPVAFALIDVPVKVALEAVMVPPKVNVPLVVIFTAAAARRERTGGVAAVI